MVIKRGMTQKEDKNDLNMDINGPLSKLET